MSLDRGMDKEDVVHIHSGIPLALRRKETMSFAATWIHLEIIVLSEISQIKTNTV